MDANNFWSAASAIAGIGVLIVTAVYAWLTHRLAKVAETQSWEAGRGRVVVSVGSNQGGQLFLLEIANVGVSSAENLRVEVNKPLHQQLGQNRPLTDAPLFANGLRALPSGKVMKFALGVSFHWLNEEADRSLHPTSFDVRVRYETLGRHIEECFPIDIEQQYSLSAIDKDYLDDFGRNFPDKFTRSMDKIAKQIDALSDKSPPRILKRRSWSEWFWKDRSWESWQKRW